MFDDIGVDESLMYSEVYGILDLLGEEYIKKIPGDLYEYIDSNRNKESEKIIDRHKSIEEQGFLDKTIEFISFLNLEYWADVDEKRELTKIYEENDRKYEEERRRKYIPNGLKEPFKNSSITIKEKQNSNLVINSDENKELAIPSNSKSIVKIEKNDNIFKRIANFFKKIFMNKR